ncbi:MAG: acyl-CoA dehydratase activase-related protein, partial [Spirochaetia bacterium]|nr:acyl-CoA dehydratase activase-related protein [Spirochaetia bacterium]
IEKLESVKEAEVKKVKFAPPLSSALHLVHIHEDEKPLFTTEAGLTVFKKPDEKRSVVIGVDGGSTTTKALIADSSTMEILAEICIDTDGRPLEAAQKVFREIKDIYEDNLDIKGITYTGSSGQFYHRLFTNFTRSGKDVPGCETDIVKDEITCHAEGVRFFNSDVDTIFECGGQDAKFTVFNPDGTVKKAKMNLSCMAGTGQSMKNMLDMLGLDFKTFRDYALAAKRTPVSDEMCAIFTEADILKLVALGFPVEEVAAATAYGFMGGYANKFVGNEKFGKLASAQGGPFKGKECLASLALHTGAEIHAFPHRQLFGAMGAALVAFNRVKKLLKEGKTPLCRFRGFGVADIGFEKLTADCSSVITDSCGIRDCRLQIYKIGDEMVFSGGLCPKGNTQSFAKKSPDYIALYKKELDKELSRYSSLAGEGAKTDEKKAASKKSKRDAALAASAIYIPRSLHFLNERGLFFASLYHYLGFNVFLSPESDEQIAALGIAHSHSESCYPSKLHYGHTAYLKEFMRQGIDKILLVNYLGSGEEKAPQNQSKTCPYVSGAGFAAKDALKIDSSDVLLPVLVFNDDIYRLEDDILKDLKRAFAGTEYEKSLSAGKVASAVKKALKTQEDFNGRMHRMGREIVEKLKKKNEKIFLGIGRGYTIFDNMASSKIHELFIMNGLHFIPCFFLKQPDYDFTDIVRHMYWFQGREMTRYNLLAALDPNLYGVRETNFNCGPDAMLSYHEGRIFDITGKPYLTLQTDGHNSNAQFGTRAMANFEVVKNHIPQKVTLKDLETEYRETDDLKKRLLGIPDMGTESAEMLAAVFKSAGYRAEVMPTKTRETEAWARKYLITNNCLPMHILFGDVFAWVYGKQGEGLDPNRDLAVFVPMAGGPCRLGQYHIIVKQFLDECGFDRVLIVNPAAYLDWENLPVSRKERSIIRRNLAKAAIASDILMNAQLSIRPYEIVKGSTDAFFAEIRKEFLKITGDGCDFKKLTSFMKKASQECREIDANITKRFPLVSLFGEIFVRSHTGANENSIRKLESFKLEIVPRLLADMFEYVNKMQRAAYWKEKQYVLWLGALVKGLYMMKVEKGLSRHFSGILAHRRFRRPIDLYNELRKENIFDVRIKGEAGISIGITHDFINSNSEGLSGVYQVEPFGCMQECVASSKIQSLIDIKKVKEKNPAKRVIPYLTGVFGDSELSNLEAEMAMFAEKCYVRQKLESADRNK